MSAPDFQIFSLHESQLAQAIEDTPHAGFRTGFRREIGETDFINPARLRLERADGSSREHGQVCGSGGDRAAGALANRFGYRPGVLQQAWDRFVDQEDLGDKVFNWNPGGIFAV